MVMIQDRLVEDHLWGDLVGPLASFHGLLDYLLGERGPGHVLGGYLLLEVCFAPFILVRAAIGR